MRLIYELFYRQQGTRFLEMMINQKRYNFQKLSKSALFHDTSWSAEPNVVTSLPHYQGYNKKILVENILQYHNPQGNFRRPAQDVNSIIRPWRRENVSKWVIAEAPYLKENNPEVLIVENYGYLNRLHRYVKLRMSPFYQWKNFWNTVWANVAKIAEISPRHQFIVIDVPSFITGKTMLDKFCRMPDSEQMNNIIGLGGNAGFMQLDLWRWLTVPTGKMVEGATASEEDREEVEDIDPRKQPGRNFSLINQIKPEHYTKINLIFRGKNGKTILINLGYLNSWIKGQPLVKSSGSTMQFNPITIQKFFLKMYMTLNELEETGAGMEDGQGTATQSELIDVKEEPETTEELKEPDDIDHELTAESEIKEDDFTDEDEAEPDDERSGLMRFTRQSVKPKPAPEVEKPVTPVEKEQTLQEKIDEANKTLDDVQIVSGFTQSSRLKDIESDLAALDRLNMKQIRMSGLKKTGEHLDAAQDETEDDSVETYLETKPSIEEANRAVYDDPLPEERLVNKIAEDADAGLLTAAEYRKLTAAVAHHEESKDPYGSANTRNALKKIDFETLRPENSLVEIKVGDEVPDKTMAGARIQANTKHYVRHVLKRNIVQMVDAIQSTGTVIKNHEVIKTSSVLGNYERHRVEVKPIDGQSSVIQFTLPEIKEDGTFMASGNKYVLRQQRIDLPIRKIAPTIVGLSTYYGKTFVQINPKVSNSQISYLTRKINLSITDPDNYIKSVALSDVFDNKLKAPLIYNAMANSYEKIGTNEVELWFNHRTREQLFPKDVLARIEEHDEKSGLYTKICAGKTKAGQPIVIDNDGVFYEVVQNTHRPIGDLFELLNIPREKAPVNFSEVRVFSKYVPVGVVLGYYIGFKALLSLVNAKYRLVPTRKNKNLQDDEFAITFKDCSLVFKDNNDVASMIMAGFLDFANVTKLYNLALFDSKDIYLNLLMTKKIGAIYIRELDMMEDSFVDPISRDILIEMNEPTSFKGLLVRSTEMLTTYHHPSSQSREAMRERGYERVAGAIYRETMKSIRAYRNKNLFGKSKIDISPYEVWNSILKDAKIAEDINPIQNLKESEVFVYAGIGGRGKESMVKVTRAADESDFGIASESTVDSSAVGTIVYMSANPNVDNVYGLASKKKEINPASVVSTSALLAPCILTDDPKRIMFASTQNSHTVASPAYRQGSVLTGYEYVIGKRTSKLFSTAAEEDGVVKSVTDKGIIVQYASGRTEGVELGNMIGRAEGTLYPQPVMTTLKEGQKFKAGDTLAYNTNFFEPSYTDPSKIIYKSQSPVTVAFMEVKQTHEDSSMVTQKFSERFLTTVIKPRSFIVNFKQNLHDVVQKNQKVKPDDLLLLIEKEITSTHSQFSSGSMDALRRFNNLAPSADVNGTIHSIEVYYNGDKEEMSPSLRRLVDRSDAELSKARRSAGEKAVTGQVTEEYRVSGKPLMVDTAEIRINILITAGTGVGDKVIFGHQMKSTIAEVLPASIMTENGQEVEAVFSYDSVGRRGLLSPSILGTTMALIDVLNQRVVTAYEA